MDEFDPMLTFPDMDEEGAMKASGATSDTALARSRIDLWRYTAIHRKVKGQIEGEAVQVSN